VLRALRDRWPGRRLGRWLGALTIALAFGFIGARLWQAGAWDLVRSRLELLLPATIAGALLYGLSGFLLSAAWRQILAAERPPGPAAAYHAIYGRTQIAKYLPGNCFHFVGRQVLGRALGHSQAALALASLLEAALLIAVAASLALPLAFDRLGGGALTLLAGAGLLLALSLAAPRLLPARLWPATGSAAPRNGVPAAGRLLRALTLHVAFFVTAGGLLWLLAASCGAPATPAGIATCIGALALAWVAGFVVPGAAAGVGVREAVLMVALDGVLAPEAAAVVALAFRLVTTVGDGVFCALALTLPAVRIVSSKNGYG
jgi:glycosyltransferase 2 family protein